MASVEQENFSNKQVDVHSLPKYEDLLFSKISINNRNKAMLQVAIFALLLLVGNFVLYYVVNVFWVLWLVAAVSTILVLLLLLNSILANRAIGYALREKDIAFKRGYLVQKITLIPFNRIQHVSTSRSLLDKFFSIAQLKVYTAGGQGSDIIIPGLLPNLAVEIKEQIANKISENANDT